MSKLEHPAIIKCVRSALVANRLYLQLELAETDLEKLLVRRLHAGKPLLESEALGMMFPLLHALQYLHERRIMHRDIKAANIMIMEDGTVRLGDFGVSKQLTDSFAETLVGTPLNMAPELFAMKPYGFAADIWALGCVFYQICALALPFTTPTGNGFILRALICDTEPAALPNSFSAELRDVIASMLRKIPSERPSASALLALPLFRHQALPQPSTHPLDQTARKPRRQGTPYPNALAFCASEVEPTGFSAAARVRLPDEGATGRSDLMLDRTLPDDTPLASPEFDTSSLSDQLCDLDFNTHDLDISGPVIFSEDALEQRRRLLSELDLTGILDLTVIRGNQPISPPVAVPPTRVSTVLVSNKNDNAFASSPSPSNSSASVVSTRTNSGQEGGRAVTISQLDLMNQQCSALFRRVQELHRRLEQLLGPARFREAHRLLKALQSELSSGVAWREMVHDIAAEGSAEMEELLTTETALGLLSKDLAAAMGQ